MHQDTIKQIITNFLTTKFLIEFNAEVTEETDLFDEGLMDSFNYMELVSFIEKEFQVKISDEELVSNTLNSVLSIVEWLRNKN